MAILGEETFALISDPGTMIGDIVPHVVIEEIYRDQVITTDHPVEKGAAVTDHAFRRPPTLEIRCGWSNSTARSSGFVVQVYEQLVSLQERSRQKPIDVYTPRRHYENMVMGEVQAVRDGNTNEILACSVALRAIIIVESQTTGGDAASQAEPASTASPADAGPVSTTPGQGYDFSQANVGSMGNSSTFANGAPQSPITGVGEQAFGGGYTVGSIPGADASAYGASTPQTSFTGVGDTAFGSNYSVGSIYGSDPAAYANGGIGAGASGADVSDTAFGAGYSAGSISGANANAFGVGGLAGGNEVTNTAPDGSSAPLGAASTADTRPIFDILGASP
jgi:hypothetical protein